MGITKLNQYVCTVDYCVVCQMAQSTVQHTQYLKQQCILPYVSRAIYHVSKQAIYLGHTIPERQIVATYFISSVCLGINTVKKMHDVRERVYACSMRPAKKKKKMPSKRKVGSVFDSSIGHAVPVFYCTTLKLKRCCTCPSLTTLKCARACVCISSCC